MAEKNIKTLTRLQEKEANIFGTTNDFFTGSDNTINQEIEPIVLGYSFIFWIKLPSWFEKDPDLKYFKNMTEKNFLSFTGLTDMELSFNEKVSGFTGSTYAVVSHITRGNTDFTLRHKEFRGSIMRKLYQKWITYISDPRTGVALYPSAFDTEYANKNHSGQLLYVTVSPDVFMNGDSSQVEFAAFYSNVVPKSIPIGQYNYEMGSHESPDIDISFNAVIDIGPDVETLAKEYIKQFINGSATNNGIKFIDSFGVKLGENESFIDALGIDVSDVRENNL